MKRQLMFFLLATLMVAQGITTTQATTYNVSFKLTKIKVGLTGDLDASGNLATGEMKVVRGDGVLEDIGSQGSDISCGSYSDTYRMISEDTARKTTNRSCTQGESDISDITWTQSATAGGSIYISLREYDGSSYSTILKIRVKPYSTTSGYVGVWTSSQGNTVYIGSNQIYTESAPQSSIHSYTTSICDADFSVGVSYSNCQFESASYYNFFNIFRLEISVQEGGGGGPPRYLDP